jgi:hypothetical protein
LLLGSKDAAGELRCEPNILNIIVDHPASLFPRAANKSGELFEAPHVALVTRWMQLSGPAGVFYFSLHE